MAISATLLGLLVPVYSDEIGWRFQARWAFDGVDRSIAVNCGPNTLAQVPMFMRPLRYASAALNLGFADPLYVRLAGVGCALAWLALLWTLIGQVSRTRDEANTIRTIGFSLASLGLLPFIQIISRPEQPLLLTLTAALSVAVLCQGGRVRADDSLAASAVRAALIVLFGAIALGYHLKGVVFMPVFLMAAATSSNGPRGRWCRVAAISTLIGLTLTAAHYWIGRFRCPGDPLLAAKLSRENIASAMFGDGAIWPTLGKVVRGLDPFEYILLTMPKMRNMSDWLPGGVLSHGVALTWTIGIMAAWVACLLLAAGILIGKVTWTRPLALRPALLPLTIIACVMIWSMFQINRNVYESALTVPLTIISFVLIFSLVDLPPRNPKLLRAVAGLCVALSISSTVLVFCFYTPVLWESSKTAGYLGKQKYSMSPYGYSAIHAQIVSAGRLCGHHDDAGTKSLLVDDLTYLAYMNSWRPLHRNGVLSDWNGSVGDPVRYLRTHHSSGAVIGCRYLPPALLEHAQRVGAFCCLDARF